MGESLRDFGERVSAVTAGGAMIGAENPETLRRSMVAQVLYCSRQPHPKPRGQRISFSPKLLAATGVTL